MAQFDVHRNTGKQREAIPYVVIVQSSLFCLGRLQRPYGIGNWKKKKGFATVVFEDGASACAEVHWYEAHGIGKMEMKIKEFI